MLSKPSSTHSSDYIKLPKNHPDYTPKSRRYMLKTDYNEVIALRQRQNMQRAEKLGVSVPTTRGSYIKSTQNVSQNEYARQRKLTKQARQALQTEQQKAQDIADITGRPILLKVQIQSTPTPPSQPSVKQGKNTYWSAVYLYTSKHPGTTIADTRSDPDFKQLYKDLMTRINELKAAKDLKGATKDTTIIGIMNAMDSYDDDEWDFIYF